MQHEPNEPPKMPPSLPPAEEPRRPTAGLRLASMLLDLLFVLVLSFVLYFFIDLAVSLAVPRGANGLPTQHTLLRTMQVLVVLTSWLLLNKDFAGGRSFGKRIMGLLVVDARTLQPATPLQCLIRNFTLPLALGEAIVTLISPMRRLGDYISTTAVVAVQPVGWWGIWRALGKERLLGTGGHAVLLGLLYAFLMMLLQQDAIAQQAQAVFEQLQQSAQP